MNHHFLDFKEEENRYDKKSPSKKKFNFDLYKKNTINSIYDVEYFLNNFNHILKSIKLYKIIKS